MKENFKWVCFFQDTNAQVFHGLLPALGVSALGYQIARRRGSPLLASAFSLPTRRDLDPQLLAGAALFGIGWGLGGFCPGPALAGLLQGVTGVYVFVGAMLAGIVLHRVVYTPLRARH